MGPRLLARLGPCIMALHSFLVVLKSHLRVGKVSNQMRSSKLLRFWILDFRFWISGFRFSIFDFRVSIFDLRFSLGDSCSSRRRPPRCNRGPPTRAVAPVYLPCCLDRDDRRRLLQRRCPHRRSRCKGARRLPQRAVGAGMHHPPPFRWATAGVDGLCSAPNGILALYGD